MRRRKSLDKRKKMKARLVKECLRYGSATTMSADGCFSCTTFNILAPIYNRLDKEDQSCRESQFKAYWLSRNESIIGQLLEERSSIICLQVEYRFLLPG
ncbi:hypothetical protein KSP40_PGU014300 [Platanthera guangdongensis]|uniref:Uncharacterized protein n=1 Tax=Platanthera guangdongensis TaxID=2320717 RepID=A0ABR2LMA0_9ASPA